MNLAQQYASNIRKETGLFAAWTPNEPIQLGDYGSLKGALFQRRGSIGSFAALPSTATAGYDLTIGARRELSTKTQLLADYGVSHGKALLEIGFDIESGIVFSAPDAQISRVKDIEAVGRRMLEPRGASKWDMNNSVVVEITTVSKATILVSQKSGAQAKFVVAANTSVNGAAMAKLDAETSLVMEKGVGFKIIGTGPLTPLFRLAFLESHFFGFSDPTIEFRGEKKVDAERIKLTEKEYLLVY